MLRQLCQLQLTVMQRIGYWLFSWVESYGIVKQAARSALQVDEGPLPQALQGLPIHLQVQLTN